MHVVHALPFFDPATIFGGPIRQLRQVCELLAQRGHRVSVVTTEAGAPEMLPRNRWVERDGFRVWYASSGPLGKIAPFYAPRAAAGLNDSLHDADVLHLALSFTHMNSVAVRLARRHRVPYIYTPRSCLDPVRLGQRRLMKAVYLRLFERRIILGADAVHVLSEAERDQVVLQGVPFESCVCIPNGCNIDASSLPSPDVFRERFALPDNTTIVLYMSRLHRVKGVDLLIRGFAEARRDGPDATLVVAGPDEGMRQDLERLSQRLGLGDGVRFVGHLDGKDRLSALAAADIFALTSHSEGMPNAVLEACAAATPVVITAACNLPEVSDHGAGIVVEPTVAGIAAGIGSLLRDPSRRREMGRRAARMVEARFAMSEVIDRLESLYACLAGRSHEVSERSASRTSRERRIA